MQTETGYREHFEHGAKAGRDALHARPEAEIVGLRLRVTSIANALETAWHDAAYARGFLKATEPPPQFTFAAVVATGSSLLPRHHRVIADGLSGDVGENLLPMSPE
jgi:hypothetical protein